MAAPRKKRWSQHVTETSDALTLDQGVFSGKDPRGIARSLRRSAERSRRRKSSPYRSAMSMLTFYINRAGTHMPAPQKRVLESAKDELRKLYGKEPAAKKPAKRGTRRAAGKRTRSARRTA